MLLGIDWASNEACRKEEICLMERGSARIRIVRAIRRKNIVACSANRWKRFRILSASAGMRVARERSIRVRIRNLAERGMRRHEGTRLAGFAAARVVGLGGRRFGCAFGFVLLVFCQAAL